MLEAIGAGSRRRIGDRDWADIWADSPEHAENQREIKRLKEEAIAKGLADEGSHLAETEYATPFLTQLKVVLARNNNALWRNPDYQFTKLFNHSAIALLTGLTFLQVGNSTADLQYRVFGYVVAPRMARNVC